MSDVLSWLFFLSVCVHNAEEGLWLPRWSKAGGWLRWSVDPAAFRFAVAVLTGLALIAVMAATGSEANSHARHVLAGYGLAMALNAIVPHLAVTLVERAYMPGTATGLFLVLPVSVALVIAMFHDPAFDAARFAVVGPIVVLVLAASVPVLQLIGRLIFFAGRPA